MPLGNATASKSVHTPVSTPNKGKLARQSLTRILAPEIRKRALGCEYSRPRYRTHGSRFLFARSKCHECSRVHILRLARNPVTYRFCWLFLAFHFRIERLGILWSRLRGAYGFDFRAGCFFGNPKGQGAKSQGRRD